jgi:hypothetical protein
MDKCLLACDELAGFVIDALKPHAEELGIAGSGPHGPTGNRIGKAQLAAFSS